MEGALRFMAGEGLDLILTSGGLGPTADDLTAEVVGKAQGRAMVLDEALEGRIAEILRPLAKRWPNLDMDAIRQSNRKQAVIPEGATVLEPVGTAPGLVVPPLEPLIKPTVVVLPGPQGSCSRCGGSGADRSAEGGDKGCDGVSADDAQAVWDPRVGDRRDAAAAEREGVEFDRLEITTCLKRGEVEVVTRYEPGEQGVYDGSRPSSAASRRHAVLRRREHRR